MSAVLNNITDILHDITHTPLSLSLHGMYCYIHSYVGITGYGHYYQLKYLQTHPLKEILPQQQVDKYLLWYDGTINVYVCGFYEATFVIIS